MADVVNPSTGLRLPLAASASHQDMAEYGYVPVPNARQPLRVPMGRMAMRPPVELDDLIAERDWWNGPLGARLRGGIDG